MSLTSELTEILKLLSLGLEKNKTIYLEGEPGVGKTKITEHLAQCLKLPIYIFQMSANVELSDLIGGLELSYSNDQKQIVLNRKKELLERIEKGGIFVLDESAMSQQAKEVIAWFSELAQKKPGERISLRDIPGHPKELIIHKDFHLILTSNNPKTTIGRKELPNEVSYFAEKIIYPETEKAEDIIAIVEKMIKRITGQRNLTLAEGLGNFHFEWSQGKVETEDKTIKRREANKRDLLKVIHLLKQKIQNNQVSKQDQDRAIY